MCTFIGLKNKELGRALSKGAQTYFVEQKAVPGWGRNTARLGLWEGKPGRVELQRAWGLWK